MRFGSLVSSYASKYSEALRKKDSDCAIFLVSESILQDFRYGGRCASDGENSVILSWCPIVVNFAGAASSKGMRAGDVHRPLFLPYGAAGGKSGFVMPLFIPISDPFRHPLSVRRFWKGASYEASYWFAVERVYPP
jgi:hypothetical protein